MSRPVGQPGPGQRVCWRCHGNGQLNERVPQSCASPSGYRACETCEATGVVSSRPILERLEATRAAHATHWRGKRWPKAFYLVPDDWAEFMATDPPTINTQWGNNPPQDLVEPAFEGVPVRKSKGQRSKLYDNTSSGRQIA